MSYSVQLRKKAINLRLEGNTLNEITSKLHIAKSTASLWLKNTKLSPKAKVIIKKKRKDTCFQPGNTHWQKAKDKADYISWTPKKVVKLKKLYNSGLSMKQVGEEMGYSISAISSIMKRHRIKRRLSSQTNKIRFYNSPLSFNPKKDLTQNEQQLKVAGLMLYWAEGAKKLPDKVDFANSDPLMIKVFIKFLRQIYQVNEARIRCLIYCYPSHNINY
jgi:transposase